MRRAILLCAAATAAAAAFGTGVASAQSPCQLPKGWYTSAAQYQYDVYTETGFMGTRVQRYIPPPGASIDTHQFIRRIPLNAYGLAAGTATSAAFLVDATTRFVTGMAMATVSEPPSCTARRKRK